ncbi:MAG TPA: metallophosphoesterase [Acidobacteriota bacterium]|nr:metallophosphoesterase [Acidobacteriota bacterium]
MKFLVLGDPHGSIPKVPKALEFDAVICTGDFCVRKPLIPYLFTRKSLSGATKKAVIKKLNDSAKAVAKFIISLNKPTYIIPGNWDIFFKEQLTLAALFKGAKHVKDCHNKVVDAGNVSIIGYGETSAPEFPTSKKTIQMYTKSEIKSIIADYTKSFARTEKLFEKAIEKNKPIVFLVHNPPFHTSLDKINNKKSPRNGEHVGSNLTRRMIESHRPAICICGHIHEGVGIIKLKDTIVLNAGCLESNKPFLFDSDTMSVKPL